MPTTTFKLGAAGSPLSLEHNFMLDGDRKAIDIIKYTTPGSPASYSTVESFNIDDTSVGLQVVSDGTDVTLEVITPIGSSNVGPTITLPLSDDPEMYLEPDASGDQAFYIGFIDIRIGRCKIEFDAATKFNIKRDNSQSAILIEIHKK